MRHIRPRPAQQGRSVDDRLLPGRQERIWRGGTDRLRICEHAREAGRRVARRQRRHHHAGPQRAEEQHSLLHRRRPAQRDRLARGDILAAQGKRAEAVAAYQAAHKAMDSKVEYRNLVDAKLTALGAAPAAASGVQP